MIKFPDDAICEVCGVPATIHLADTREQTEHLYCRQHEPSRPVGASSPRFAVKRWRMYPLENHCSKRLAASKESQSHQDLRWEMCEGQLLGREGACRYYLSMITGIDHFVLWDDEFVANVREFVIAESSGAAACFTFDWSSVQQFWPYLKLAYERYEGSGKGQRIRKRDEAIEMLVNHPSWTDEEIAAKVPTTLKQLARNTDYSYLRSNLQRARGQANG